MKIHQKTASYSRIALTPKEASETFGVTPEFLRKLEDEGFLDPEAAAVGVRERYYYDAIQKAIIAKADDTIPQEYTQSVERLRTGREWEKFFFSIFSAYGKLPPRALAIVTADIFAKTLPAVLNEAGEFKLPNIGVIRMQQYQSRQMYDPKDGSTKTIPARVRPVFEPCKSLRSNHE